jgi:glutaconate CoA-transferase subunit B
VATGVASWLPILAIAVARATRAPNLTYLACVGALDPNVTELHTSSEDLEYLGGRRAEVTIADLFDHARRGRITTVFFGAAEVDGQGHTNMTGSGDLANPGKKFPGVAGACSLRRWVARPVLVVGRHTRRTLVPRVQIASTRDPERRTTLVTDLAVFEVGAPEATLVARHPWTTEEEIADSTGFSYSVVRNLAVTPPPDEATRLAISAIDVRQLRHGLLR